MTFVLLGDSQTLTPERIVAAHDAGQVPAALESLQAALDDGYYAAGFFAYELGYVLEPKLAGLLPEKRKIPLLWFALARGFGTPPLADAYTLGPVQTMAADDYMPKCRAVLDAIHAGEIYQANLTMRARFPFTGDPLGLYQALRRRQPGPYGGMIFTPDFSILSLSPELFIDIRGRDILTRPMKGTAPRGRDILDDAAQKTFLAGDEKQRAENLMIVDLMRNDLSRIGTGINVPRLFDIETHPTLHQMTSDVRATLKTDRLADLLRALFPAGSITGAPKIRAMEIIAGLETEPRGAYCGAFGLLHRDASWLNVAIRTLTIQNGVAEIGIGSGVVADSDPAAEYHECLLKMKFMDTSAPDFALFETLLFDGQGYTLMDEHMARLRYSCAVLGFPAPGDIAFPTPDAPCVVRLQYQTDGSWTFSDRPIPESPTLTYAIAEQRLDPGDRLLYHKTTRRDLYDRPNPSGVNEMLYCNTRGELCEGARTNIFVDDGSGVLLTPALACGLLPGTLRASLLAQGRAREAVLTPESLKSAAAVYLGNSVRGLVLGVPAC